MTERAHPLLRGRTFHELQLWDNFLPLRDLSCTRCSCRARVKHYTYYRSARSGDNIEEKPRNDLRPLLHARYHLHPLNICLAYQAETQKAAAGRSIEDY